MQATSADKMAVGLAEIFPPEAIAVGLRSRTKQGAIAELVRHLVGLGYISEGEERAVVDSILAQEKSGTTALYDGVAFPHCRSRFTKRFVGVLGIEPDGIPFDAVGGGAVHCIFLFLAPLERREELYVVLGRIKAIGRDKSRRAQLRGCRSAEAAHHFLLDSDRQ
jgi:mannitol/fructose-specific phosphotransferase system IIA component (Ntr-type)